MTGPSHALFHALLALTEGLRSLGIVYHPVRQRAIVQDVIRHFVSSLLDAGDFDKLDETALHNLLFLRALGDLYGPSWNDISFKINQRLKSVVSITILNACRVSCFFSLLTRSTKSNYLLLITLFASRL